MALESFSSLHLEVSDYIISQIKHDHYKPGQKIPSEHALAETFQTNRSVIRQAVMRVTNLGWVTPVQGKGAFVNERPKPIPFHLSSRTCFSKNVEKTGKRFGSKLMKWSKEPPTEYEADRLQLGGKSLVYRLHILRSADEHPMALTTSVLPAEEVPALEKQLDHFYSLYQMLEETYHFTPLRSFSTVAAEFPSIEEGQHLETPENVPIIHIESVMNHPGGAPVELANAKIRSDMATCFIEF
ncbi:GntR family transcriptional regulator [Salibacterium aidingense]|uniref:GntR family transcriptional regulator n=1 Tax=Salibacterium aidingense TaxID=384933 RepID=UPI0003FF4E39|nr:GntR family transcriptional regulator [Salibacterium aidingense]